MTKVKYTITIHTARTNSLRLHKTDLEYKNKPQTAQNDSVQFFMQKIVLKCVRNTKRLTLDDICEYKQSTIYSQIFKSLLYLYMENGKRVHIRSIEVRTATKTDTRNIDYKNQPLTNDFHILRTIPNNVLLNIFDETPKGECLRTVSTHFLKAITSKDRYFKFERLWRAFEQLAYWHEYHSALPQKPNEGQAMIDMRTLICTNPQWLTDSINCIDHLNSHNIDKLHWKRLIETNYPYTGKIQQLNYLIDNLINQNKDIRLCRVLKKACSLRSAGLKSHNLYTTAENTIEGYRNGRLKHNEHILSLIVCKYCYFMRNKMFHGQEADFTFCFTNHTEDDDITDLLNNILESTIIDLLCCFDNI